MPQSRLAPFPALGKAEKLFGCTQKVDAGSGGVTNVIGPKFISNSHMLRYYNLHEDFMCMQSAKSGGKFNLNEKII